MGLGLAVGRLGVVRGRSSGAETQAVRQRLMSAATLRFTVLSIPQATQQFQFNQKTICALALANAT